MEFGSVTLKINNQHTLQGIDPQTKGKPAYASYIGAKVHQRFEALVEHVFNDTRKQAFVESMLMQPVYSQLFS